MATLRVGSLVLFAIIFNVQQSSASIFKSPLSNSFHLNQLDRVKRQAKPHNSSAAPDPDHDPDICVIKCLRSTEEHLGGLQEEDKKNQSPLSPQSALNRDYDPKDFQKLCDAYRPGRKCLDSCDNTNLKTAALKGMALLQFMCVERFDDFKENLPCMNNASAAAEIACKPNCSEFEQAVNRLEELAGNRDLVTQVSQQQLTRTLAGSCLYVECLGHCGNPITEKQCGKKVAELDEELVKHVFNSLRNTVTALGAGDQLPKECVKLSG